jgi:hypothetical protein
MVVPRQAQLGPLLAAHPPRFLVLYEHNFKFVNKIYLGHTHHPACRISA